MLSRKTFAVLIVCGAAVVSVWLLRKSFSPTKTMADASTASAIDTNPPRQTADEIDSDSDGLKDWQETLIGTDPHNPDTDGDGTTDGVEIEAGRDPRVKGPDDKNPNVTTIVGNDSAGTDADTTEGTLTSQMSKDFFAQYLLLKKNGGQVTADEVSQIVQNTLSMPQYTKPTAAVYTASDLHINANTNKQIVQEYNNVLAQSLIRNTPKNLENEYVILTRAVQKEDPNELVKMDQNIIGYKGLVADLINMTIPSDAVAVHLAFLNSTSNMLSDTEAMRVTFTDPVRSFAAVSQYKQHSAEFITAYQKLDEYLKEREK